jgi:hypothetical protein
VTKVSDHEKVRPGGEALSLASNWWIPGPNLYPQKTRAASPAFGEPPRTPIEARAMKTRAISRGGSEVVAIHSPPDSMTMVAGLRGIEGN